MYDGVNGTGEIQMKKDTVGQGEKSEQIFQTICFATYGYMVSDPISQVSYYDKIVDVNDRLLRVQVKTDQNGDGNVIVSQGTGGNKYPYSETLDFFAIHMQKINEWYIIPRSATEDHKHIRIALKREGKYTKYKNNWNFKECMN